MTEHHAVPQRHTDSPIVAAVDGSAVGYHAAAWAAADAALRDCRLHLVTSISVAGGLGPAPILTEDDMSWLRVDAERILVEAARIARAATPDRTPVITTEITTDAIIGHLIAQSDQAQGIVVGSRGLGAIRRGLLGSVSSAIIRHANCPVTVVHSISATDAVTAVKPVLVGVDGTANSVPALELAFEEASRRTVGLVVLHAWSDRSSGLDPAIVGWDAIRESEDAVLAETLAGYSERYPDVKVRREMVLDRPVRSLLDASENAQLVVVGSHGRGGFTGMLLGSTSAALAQSVECPITVVRQPAGKTA
ncbi:MULTISPECIES: universal stress protein [Nocardia]|uniref:Universal stress protein n=2 Tax=Nocardia TaxID=1817 RepID=A0A2T2ZAS7_9NOCA|nr:MULTISPECIES: universal stress protein [Nocardia]MBF6449396.1 universal stress protein [Nocardia elegans]PSR64860.1 universal stress protein [Nocardia nova]